MAKVLIILIFSLYFIGCTHSGGTEFVIEPENIHVDDYPSHYYHHRHRSIYHHQKRPKRYKKEKDRKKDIDDEFENLPQKRRYFDPKLRL